MWLRYVSNTYTHAPIEKKASHRRDPAIAVQIQYSYVVIAYAEPHKDIKYKRIQENLVSSAHLHLLILLHLGWRCSSTASLRTALSQQLTSNSEALVPFRLTLLHQEVQQSLKDCVSNCLGMNQNKEFEWRLGMTQFPFPREEVSNPSITRSCEQCVLQMKGNCWPAGVTSVIRPRWSKLFYKISIN